MSICQLLVLAAIKLVSFVYFNSFPCLVVHILGIMVPPFFSASTYSAWTRGQHTVRQECSEHQQNGVPQAATKDPETQRPEPVAGRRESEGKLYFLRASCCRQYRPSQVFQTSLCFHF